MTVAEYNKSVEEHADGIYRFILKNLKDQDQAKDVVQDTFEKLWKKAGEVSYLKVKSYLFTTAYHTMIDMLRREKKKGDFDAVNPEDYAHNTQYTGLQEILHLALSRLPEQQRSVILLRDYEGYSYQEIAEITGLSESQVKVYIYRGRVFLKNYLGKVEAII